MDWSAEVELRCKRKNQILFAKDSPFLRGLQRTVEGLDHRTLVLWALDLAEETVTALEACHPAEERPRAALQAARAWAAGEIKMRLAQRCILDCHGLAKELNDKAEIAACHAVGQACSVVHTAGHAMGYPIYDLTALVYRYGVAGCRQAVEARCRTYFQKLLFWQSHPSVAEGKWAAFLRG